MKDVNEFYKRNYSQWCEYIAFLGEKMNRTFENVIVIHM